MAGVTAYCQSVDCGRAVDLQIVWMCPGCGGDTFGDQPPVAEQKADAGTRGDGETTAPVAISISVGDAVLELQDGARLGLGRSDDYPDATAFRPFDNVSRTHAMLRRSGCHLFLTDTGSANGTFVNGERLASGIERELTPGDVPRLASNVVLTVNWPAEFPTDGTRIE